jgi:hypothetical protein
MIVFLINLAKHEKMPLHHVINYKEIDDHEQLEKEKEELYKIQRL